MDILLVEDNQADASLLTEFLTETPQKIQVHWVTDGYAALDFVFRKGPYAQAARPDVILLDLGLPRIDGYDVLKEVKKTGQMAIPVIILTTSRNPLDRKQCLQLGADSFLSKPYNLEGYERLIHELLETEFPRLLQTPGLRHAN